LRTGAALTTLLAAALTAVAPAAAAPTISAQPELFPAFDPDVHDYVSRCGDDVPLRLAVAPGPGGSARVGRGAAHRASFDKRVRLTVGRRTIVRSREGGRTTAYHVRCLPPGFPTWTALKTGRSRADFYLITPVGDGLSRWLTMVDPQGTPVWWLEAKTATIDARLLPNGHVAWSRYRADDIFGLKRSQAYEEHTLDGRRVRVIKAVGSATDIHDMQALPNGNTLLITYKPRDGVDLRSQRGPQNATVLDGEVQEVDPHGRLVWSWNSKDHVDLSERGPAGPLADPVELPDGRKAYNLVHLNSVEPHGNGRLLLSMRLPSALYEVDRASGEIVWKLGGTETRDSLRVIGDPYPPPTFGGQHDARVLRDGTVTLFDNGTGRGRPPRAVRYRVDEDARTATLLEQVVDPAVTRSNFAGSARRLPGGNWLISWGGTSLIEELTSAGAPVFSLRLADTFFSYRAFPVPGGSLRTSTLRKAMDRRYRRRR